MKKMLFLGLVLIAGFLQFAAAQQPGYLGRKDLLRYDLFIAPAELFSLNQKPGFHVNHSHELGYERIVSRRHVLGVSACYLRLPNQVVTNEELPDPGGVITRQSGGIGIHFKAHPFLKKGWLAPLGPYVRLALSVNLARSVFHSVKPDVYPPSLWARHLYNSYSIGFGYSNIIGDRLLVDLGFRICSADMINGAWDGLLSKSTRIASDAIAIRRTEFLKFHLGIGFLLGK